MCNCPIETRFYDAEFLRVESFFTNDENFTSTSDTKDNFHFLEVEIEITFCNFCEKENERLLNIS